MHKSWWIEDIWTVQLVGKTFRWLCLSVLALFFILPQQAGTFFIPGFQYFVVLIFGNEFVSYISKQEMLSFQTVEWVRFLYNLLIYNHLLAVTNSDHFVIALIIFVPVLYQGLLASHQRGFWFILFSYFSSYWISMAFLSKHIQTSTANFGNLFCTMLIAGVISAFRQVVELERARSFILRIKVEELEETLIKAQSSNKRSNNNDSDSQAA